jgi:hypothetical protein
VKLNSVKLDSHFGVSVTFALASQARFLSTLFPFFPALDSCLHAFVAHWPQLGFSVVTLWGR